VDIGFGIYVLRLTAIHVRCWGQAELPPHAPLLAETELADNTGIFHTALMPLSCPTCSLLTTKAKVVEPTLVTLTAMLPLLGTVSVVFIGDRNPELIRYLYF
jgi:hypothetical protein